MPLEDYAQYFYRNWPTLLQTAGVNGFGRLRPHLGILIQETSQALADGYNGVQDATTRYIHHAATGAATPGESMDLESQPATMGDTIHNQTNLNPFTAESYNPEDTGQTAKMSMYYSDETDPARSRRTWTLVARLIVVLLLLIMAPGLIVGIVTRQVAWGIAISGMFAPAVVFLGGLYYHHNR